MGERGEVADAGIEQEQLRYGSGAIDMREVGET
jgi:hypothetical protein